MSADRDSTQSDRRRTGPVDVLSPDRTVITVEEAGAVLGISRSTAYQCVKRGEIPSLRLGRRVVVPVARFRKMLGMDSE